MKAITAPITAIPAKVINLLVCPLLIGNYMYTSPLFAPSLQTIYLQEGNVKGQDKNDAMSLRIFLLVIISLHLKECNSVCCLAVSFRRSDDFDKISICTIPVKIVKGMTTAKYNGGTLIIPLHCTSTGQISVRHSYSSLVSNLTVVGSRLCC